MYEGLKSLSYDFVALSANIFFTLGFSLKTQGRNHIPKTGPVLVLANHQSGLDPLLVGMGTRRHLTFLARKTLFKKGIVNWFFRTYRTVPIDQEGVGKEGLKSILHYLAQDEAVVVFPEGTRTDDGAMNRFKPGVQLLIKRAKPTIVPVGIAGAFDAWPHWRSYPIPSPVFLPPGKSSIAVSVGPPLNGEHYASLPKQQLLDDLFDKVHTQVQRAERLRRKF